MTASSSLTDLIQSPLEAILANSNHSSVDIAFSESAVYAVVSGGGRVITDAWVIDVATGDTTKIAGLSVPNKASRADLWVSDDGFLYARHDTGRIFQVDTDTGAQTLAGFLKPADLGVATTESLLSSDNLMDQIRDAISDAKLRNVKVETALEMSSEGDVFLNTSQGLYVLNEDAFGKDLSFLQVPGAGSGTKSVITDDGQVVTLSGPKHTIDTLQVTDTRTGATREFDIGPIDNKASGAKVEIGEDGEVLVLSRAKVLYELDLEDGTATKLVNVKTDAAFAEKATFFDVEASSGNAADAIKTLSAEAAANADGKVGWIDFTSGLRELLGNEAATFETNFTSKDGALYVNARSDGLTHLVRFDGEWTKMLSLDVYGGGKDLIAGDDGIFYMGGHHDVFEVDMTAQTVTRLAQTSTTESISLRDAQYHDGKLFTVSTEKDAISGKAISVYDTQTESWTHLNIDHALDKKPHIDMMVDPDGNIWYKSNYSGIFKADLKDDGTYDDFTMVSDRSGAMHVGGDGEVYLSYEVTKFTQVSSVFRYTPDADDDWTLVHTSRGYSHNGHAIDGTEASWMGANRFDDYIMVGTQKYTVPEMDSLFGNVEQAGNDTAFTYMTQSMDGVVFGSLKSKKTDDKILTALDVDAVMTDQVPYDSDLKVESARNLLNGSAVDTEATGLEILEDGTIAVAYTVDGAGTLDIFSEDGAAVIKSLDLGAVSDMDTDPDGDVLVIASDQGAYRYDTETGTTEMIKTGSFDRIDVDAEGNVVLASGQKMYVLDDQNQEIFSRTQGGTYFEDVAIDAESGLVYAVGFQNQTLPSGLPVQGAYLRAYDFKDDLGELEWSRFEFSGNSKANNIADARLNNVEIGENGELYIMGQSAGSQTIFRYDGLVLDGPDMLTRIDHANDTWNTASAHILYHAQVDKLTGDVETSQLTMGRLESSGKSNTYSPGDIAIDADGNVFIGGKNAYGIQNRDGISINGIDVPDYDTGGDASFMALNSDFTQRYSWHSLDAGGADGRVDQVATRDGKTVLLTEFGQGEIFTTDDSNPNGSGANVNLMVINTGEIYDADTFDFTAISGLTMRHVSAIGDELGQSYGSSSGDARGSAGGSTGAYDDADVFALTSGFETESDFALL